MKFSDRLKAEMERAGISELGLADKAGYSFNSVRSWTTGKFTPSAEAIIAISRVLGVSSDRLLGIERPRAALAADGQ